MPGSRSLTDAQYHALMDGLDEMRDRFDSFFETAAALTVLGLDKPAGLITAFQDEADNEIRRLKAILIEADDAAESDTLANPFAWLWTWPWAGRKSQAEA